MRRAGVRLPWAGVALAWSVLAWSALIWIAPATAQQQVVIYRCTDAAGNVTLQNETACPAGTREQRQVIDAPPALPAYVSRAERMPEVVAVETERDQRALERALPPPVPAEERKPPPPLYQCRTWDGMDYLTEATEPQRRCAPLQVVGIGAAPLPGAASACEQVTDTCEAVPEDGLCRGWKRRVEEAEFRWKFAGADAGPDDGRRLAYETLRATYANSTCAP